MLCIFKENLYRQTCQSMSFFHQREFSASKDVLHSIIYHLKTLKNKRSSLLFQPSKASYNLTGEYAVFKKIDLTLSTWKDVAKIQLNFFFKFSKPYIQLEFFHVKTWVYTCIKVFARMLIMTLQKEGFLCYLFFVCVLSILIYFCTVYIFFLQGAFPSFIF